MINCPTIIFRRVIFLPNTIILPQRNVNGKANDSASNNVPLNVTELKKII